MILHIIKANIEGTETQCVEGTNFFKSLSYVVFPTYDNDRLLDPKKISKDGSLHEGTKIRSYLLKQDDVKYIDIWEEAENMRDIIVPDIVSPETFGMYKRNSSFPLYCGDFVDKSINEWFMPNSKPGGLFEVKYSVNLMSKHKFSYLNKVKDKESKKYANSGGLLF